MVSGLLEFFVHNLHTKSGDFLGSVLDGDDTSGGYFFACAPRFITEYSPRTENYYTNGRCLFVGNSQNVNTNAQAILPLTTYGSVGVSRFTSYYDAAFGQAGFSISFLKSENELITGAPGKALWNGALLTTKLSSNRHDLYSHQQDLANHQNNYFGYAVSWGRYLKNSTKVWYSAGGPRGGKLRGSVIFFESKTSGVLGILYGNYGSYFGASLLTIHHKDGADDILVGAPMHSGSSWDEGCVYYYKNTNKGTFLLSTQLSNNKVGSRFGSVISDIGDIDLDSLQDCAISAPYEDSGVGAVYIYFGSPSGFSSDNFQRISPSEFRASYPKMVVAGFGQGLSKGVDVDNNGHSDLVVGAYKSGQIFYFKSRNIFDVEVTTIANIAALYTTTTNFQIRCCLKFLYRSRINTSPVTFRTQVLMFDDRVKSKQNITSIFTIPPNKLSCNSHDVYFQSNHLDPEPFIVRYQYKMASQVSTYTEKSLTILTSLGCGDDNVCQTNISISANAKNRNKLIVGLDEQLEVDVTIRNYGEIAYDATLYVTAPEYIAITNLRECYIENGSYVCLIAQILKERADKLFIIDLTNLQVDHETLSLDFKVKSAGRDVGSMNTEFKLEIPIATQNDPYIDSQSIPPTVVLNRISSEAEISHLFFVGNKGPSPLNLNLSILVPQFQQTQDPPQLSKMISVSVTNDNEVHECNSFVNAPFDSTNGFVFQRANTTLLICSETLVNCTHINCEAGYLLKHSDAATFELKLFVQMDLLAKFIKDENKVTLTSIAYLHNGTKEIFATSSTLIYVLNANPISWWMYIASVILGILLLVAVIFGLYKFNFFNRTYKEKLQNEQESMLWINEVYLEMVHLLKPGTTPNV